MNRKHLQGIRRAFLTGLACTVVIGSARIAPAHAIAPSQLPLTAFYSPSLGMLTVVGTANADAITISRDAAGTILVNGPVSKGGTTIQGDVPTVANTKVIQVFGLDNNDAITLQETNGALPPGILVGGAGNDVLTGGSSAYWRTAGRLMKGR